MPQLNLRRNVVASVAAFALNLLLVFLSYRLLAQQGGPAIIGLWSSLVAWIFLIRLGDVGMTNGIVRFAAVLDLTRDADRIRGYVDTGLVLNAALFALLILVGWVVMDTNLERILPEGADNTQNVRLLLPILFAVFYLQNIAGLIGGALQAIHHGYIASILLLTGTLVQLIIAFFLIPSLGLAGLALAQLCQYTLMLIAGWQLLRMTIIKESGNSTPLLPRHASLPIAREIMGFGLKVQLVNFVNGLFEPLSKILIGHSAGLQVLGLFEMAYKLVVLPRNAIVSGVTAALPAKTRLLASDLSAARTLYQTATLKVGIAASVVLLAVVLSSPFTIFVWLGHPEPVFSLFVGLLAIGCWINALSAPAYAVGMASGAIRPNLEASLVSIGTLLILVPLAGQLGDSWPMVLSVAIATAVGASWILKRATRPWASSLVEVQP